MIKTEFNFIFLINCFLLLLFLCYCGSVPKTEVMMIEEKGWIRTHCEITDCYDAGMGLVIEYKFTDQNGVQYFNLGALLNQGSYEYYRLPVGAKYEFIYDPKRPKRKHYILLYKPVHEENINWKKTKARFLSGGKISGLRFVWYGNYKCNFEYTVNNKKYIANHGFYKNGGEFNSYNGDQDSIIKFRDQFFEIEYDEENPELCRVYLDRLIEEKN